MRTAPPLEPPAPRSSVVERAEIERSAVGDGVATERSHGLAIGFALVGALLLAARAWTSSVSGAARFVVALALFGGILVASLTVPARPGARRVPARGAFAVGAVAVAGAAIVAGTPVPLAAPVWLLPMSVLAAIAEEALFRRVLYGALERHGTAVAVVGSAVLFAAVHLPLYGTAAFPVDLGAGLLFGWQRWATGSWTTPAATHALANVVAVLR